MSELIEKLAEQCVTRKFYVDHASEEFDYKKFAELIMIECVAQCEKNAEHPYLGPGSKLSAFNIKQLFGVKE